MIIRSAILEGGVAVEDQVSFDAYMRDIVTAEILKYPGIRGVTLRRHIESDPDAVQIYMQFDLFFDSLEDMKNALASPIRDTVRDRIKTGMGPFKGRVIHIVSEQLVGRGAA